MEFTNKIFHWKKVEHIHITVWKTLSILYTFLLYTEYAANTF